MSRLFGSRLKFIRRMRGLSQQVVADHLGISRSNVSAYERGLAEPDTDLIRKLAKFYAVSTDFLLDADMQSGDPQLDELRAQLWEHLISADRDTATMILNLFRKLGKE